jgi:hypothetical protein
MLSRGECWWDYINLYPSHRSFVATRGPVRNWSFQREYWQDYIGCLGFESLAGKPVMATSCRPLSRPLFDVLLRMLVELQTLNLVVAGSNPVGSVLREEP